MENSYHHHGRCNGHYRMRRLSSVILHKWAKNMATMAISDGMGR